LCAFVYHIKLAFKYIAVRAFQLHELPDAFKIAKVYYIQRLTLLLLALQFISRL